MQITSINRTQRTRDPKSCPYCKTRQGAFRCPACNRVALGEIAEEAFSEEDITELLAFWFPEGTI